MLPGPGGGPVEAETPRCGAVSLLGAETPAGGEAFSRLVGPFVRRVVRVAMALAVCACRMPGALVVM